MNILFVLTSHDALGDTGEKTGFWIEEFAAPYYVLADAGADITLASPAGGLPPIDPKSALEEFQTDDTRRFDQDAELQQKLAHTFKLADITADQFDAIFYPGGHGPMWDLSNDQHSVELIESFARQGKLVAAVCHASSVLLHTRDAGGKPLVKNRKVTGFSNTEEAAVGLTGVVPFLLEDELKKLGGVYSQGADWVPYTVEDGQLITGQNPASSSQVAKTLLARLSQ
ncbi:type 1 glutamine amidotransferase domain-containing protein [Amphritea pacifica]|uniref:Type 1 glutamine amidotransferase domain-containing protein n=1 Tax=Amphritea pacifica TaxID=2811233 RepID=A0ABS2WB55_9GAMM|nr:type 1 glutamine amidotransferase domain-containing protein [Amphritea pacifica]MBN0988951.1 type 1 glutamine amidotransferase domain-containing protein [Amphritea pacifica]MBN1005057.1 type 1 glutamine amidotransferase domain-containing protein [Amphritea pacifica]